MVIIQSKTPYPPCQSCTCTGNQCKHFGFSNQCEWPELVGVDVVKAQTIIESTNPDVTVVVLNKGGCLAPTDLCCNRVSICPDEQDHVKDMPKIGI
ncbi:hypothetical protein H5410_024567 [Solanum commersonii]|uniref:Serine protease inhibitor, potato inhibitor I-type family protein n=1 Tax=Solanum commersonii TaxID=4109 RepID=A0A9J5ZMD0_SOLCO|nr:hypothetical protein H5410_024567 [Solanum commersonii]